MVPNPLFWLGEPAAGAVLENPRVERFHLAVDLVVSLFGGGGYVCGDVLDDNLDYLDRFLEASSSG